VRPEEETVRHLRLAALAALAAALVPALAAALNNIYSAQQGVTTGELQRFIYAPTFPMVCGDAAQVAAQMRVHPASDPKTMHHVMKVYTACTKTRAAGSNSALWNTALFGAAAAALLAARHEPLPDSLTDAGYAKSWSEALVKFERGYNSNQPSYYRTGADRMHTDAVALIAAIKAAPAH
jgi:hypothetical protein